MPPQICYLCLVVALIAVTAWPVSATPPTAATPIGTPRPAVEVTVRSGSPPLPPDCRANEVASLLMAFFEAFNHGDQAKLSRFFSVTPESPAPTAFRWYSVTAGGTHFVTYDPDALLAYFAERHEQREVLLLVRLELATGWHGGVDVAFDVFRLADDFPARVVGGKGAIDCERQTIFVWSMGDAQVLARSPDEAQLRARPYML